MKGTFKIERPENIQLTFTATASLTEWQHIKENLKGESVTCINFRSIIYDMVEKATESFTVNKE